MSPHHGAVDAEAARRASIGSCKTKPQRHRQPRRSGSPRSSRLPPELLDGRADAASADDATSDEIADLIRVDGGARSRSAVGRYTKNVRDLVLRQQETDRANEMLGAGARRACRGPGEAHPDRDLADADALHHEPNEASSNRSMTPERAWPPGADSACASTVPTSSASRGSSRLRRTSWAVARRGAGAGPGTAQEGPLDGDRRPHRRGRGGVHARRPRRPAHNDAGRPVESFAESARDRT